MNAALEILHAWRTDHYPAGPIGRSSPCSSKPGRCSSIWRLPNGRAAASFWPNCCGRAVPKPNRSPICANCWWNCGIRLARGCASPAIRSVWSLPFWLDAAEVGCLPGAGGKRRRRDGSTPEMIAALESAVALYRGDFLEGFDVESEDFVAWATLERERLRFSIIEALDRLIEAYTRQKNVHSGMDYAARLIRLDPLREKTYRLTMRLLAETGQREAALHQFEVCRQTLMTELGHQRPARRPWRCTNESALVNCPAKSRARCALHRPGGWSICPRRRRPSLAGRTRFRSCLNSSISQTAAC